jgi:hypothetical protein
MTEFGSDRYLEKIHQSQANAQSATAPSTNLPQSKFILPIRGSNLTEVEVAPTKSNDQKRSERRGFNFLKTKLHSKGSASASAAAEHTEPQPSSASSESHRRR